jgi:signal transduction histidine kinase
VIFTGGGNALFDGDLKHVIVHVDENKMSQVMRNLISNAMKFTPAQKNVHVSMQFVDCPVAVEDKGGMRSAKVLPTVAAWSDHAMNIADGQDDENAPRRCRIRIEVRDEGHGLTAVQYSPLLGEGYC